MFKSLRSGNGAMDIVAAAMAITLSTTAPASAFWGFDWFDWTSSWSFFEESSNSSNAPEDPMVLISERYMLDQQPYEAKEIISGTVEELRNNGATEEDVKSFLDEADNIYYDLDYERGGGLIYASTAAPLALCEAGPYACAVGVAAAALATLVVAAGGNKMAHAVHMAMKWVTSRVTPAPHVTIPLPPGDCPPDQHRDLQERVKSACGQPAACKAYDNARLLSEKIGNHSRCINARTIINSTCFRGGDANHRNEIKKRMDGITNCLKFMARL